MISPLLESKRDPGSLTEIGISNLLGVHIDPGILVYEPLKLLFGYLPPVRKRAVFEITMALRFEYPAMHEAS